MAPTETLALAAARRDDIVAHGHSVAVAAWQAYMEFTALTSDALFVLKSGVRVESLDNLSVRV